MKSSRDPLPSPNPATSKATATPSTSLSANASCAPGYLILLAPSHPNLNLFPKGKNNRCFRPGWFWIRTRTNRWIKLSFTLPLALGTQVAKSFHISETKLPRTSAHRRSRKGWRQGARLPPNWNVTNDKNGTKKSIIGITHFISHIYTIRHLSFWCASEL